MLVKIPTQLRSYTDGAALVTVDACAPRTLDGVLRLLDQRHAGLRFRIIDEQAQVRPHIKLFVDGVLQRDLDTAVDEARELMIVGALSGG
ncbi:MAG: MoaD/ThiS family protein [Casimicrobiaceae bacterium]